MLCLPSTSLLTIPIPVQSIDAEMMIEPHAQIATSRTSQHCCAMAFTKTWLCSTITHLANTVARFIIFSSRTKHTIQAGRRTCLQCIRTDLSSDIAVRRLLRLLPFKVQRIYYHCESALSSSLAFTLPIRQIIHMHLSIYLSKTRSPDLIVMSVLSVNSHLLLIQETWRL